MATSTWTKEAEPIFEAMAIGDRLRWLLEHKGMRQTVLAANMGTTQAMISNIITKETRKPSAPSLLDMADIFQCRPRWIMDGKGDPFTWVVATDDRQAALLSTFKRLPHNKQDALLSFVRAMSEQGAEVVPTAPARIGRQSSARSSTA